MNYMINKTLKKKSTNMATPTFHMAILGQIVNFTSQVCLIDKLFKVFDFELIILGNYAAQIIHFVTMTPNMATNNRFWQHWQSYLV